MASVVRKEFHAGRTASRVARAKLLANQAKTLKELAEHHRIPILVTNQITTHYEGEEKEKEGDEAEEEEEEEEENDEEEMEEEYRADPKSAVTAALGNSWSHFVNTRIALDFDVEDDDEEHNNNSNAVISSSATNHHENAITKPNRRTLKLLKSPSAPALRMTYALGARGPMILSSPRDLEPKRRTLVTKTALVTTKS